MKSDDQQYQQGQYQQGQYQQGQYQQGQYQQWLEQRRRTRSDPDLTDRVMASVRQTSVGQPASRWVLLLVWMDRSRLRRVAACIGALLVGSVPLVYLAYISQVFIF